MVNAILPPCMKRRMLFAASQAYQPASTVPRRDVDWLEPPMVVRRTGAGGATDLAIGGRTEAGVVVAFRGSLAPFFDDRNGWAVLLDWLNPAAAVQGEHRHYPGKVHQGFAVSTDRLWDDLPGSAGVHSMIQTLLERGRRDGISRDHIFLTGHSKGGALANLCAMRAAVAPEWRYVPISVATIGAPRLGDAAFARAYHDTRIACLRYEAAADPVPQLPCGPESPGRLRALTQGLGGSGSDAGWYAVGECVSGSGDHQPWTGSRRRLSAFLDRRGPRDTQSSGLEVLLPEALHTHAIGPDSEYDRLIGADETECEQGAEPVAAEVRRGFPLRLVA